MKTFIKCLILAALMVFSLSACAGDSDLQNSTTKQGLDSIYETIKQYKSDAFTLLDLNYDQINKTAIMVGDQAFGTRDTLVDKEGNSTQRALCFVLEDTTRVTVLLGELPARTDIKNDMISLYSDSFQDIGQAEEQGHKQLANNSVESSIFLYDNIVINVVFVQGQQKLDAIKTATFREGLVNHLINTREGNENE